jgi:hypothetical protein
MTAAARKNPYFSPVFATLGDKVLFAIAKV